MRLRVIPALMLVMLLLGCPGVGTYSDDPTVARIQALTDFCIGYRAMRDSATFILEVDTQRTEPVLSVSEVETIGVVRSFIKPFCTETFDPITEPFNLDALSLQLRQLRLLLLAKETTS
jgi:hypothetical protein